MPSQTVLLLGNYRPSIILARKLSQRGYRVVVGSHGCERGCAASNAVADIWDHSPLGGPVEKFITELREYTRTTPDLAAIFPVAEEYVRLFAENELRFAKFANLITLPGTLVNKCLDKSLMMQLALDNNVPTIPIASTSNKKQFADAIEATGFPLILRPHDSTKRLGGKKVLVVETPQELASANSELKLENRKLLIQKKFEGKRHNIYFAAHNGKIIRCLHALITRTDATDDTGLAVEGITLSPDGELVAQTKRLLKALDYSGIGCAQFLVNPETGNSSFLEINPRIAGNHALPEYADLDLGNFLFEQALGNQPDLTPVMAREGIRYCWTSGDLMGAKVAFLRKEITATGALKWCAKAIATGIRADVHMIFTPSDPMPALNAMWQVLPRIARWKKPATNPGESTIYQDTDRKPI